MAVRAWMVRPQVWHYLAQLSLPGSRGNAQAALVDLQHARAGVSPLVTALLAVPPQQRQRRPESLKTQP